MLVASQMGLLFVANQVRGDLEFFCIYYWRPSFGQRPQFRIDELKVLLEKLQLIHFQLRSHVCQGRHREDAELRMIRRAPGAGAAAVAWMRLMVRRLFGIFVKT